MDDFDISRKVSNLNLSDDEEVNQASAFKNKSLPSIDAKEDDLGRNVSEPREGQRPLDGAGSQIYSDISSGSKIRLDIDEPTESLNPTSQSESAFDIVGIPRVQNLETKASMPMSLNPLQHSASNELQAFSSSSKKPLSFSSAFSPKVSRTKHHDDEDEEEQESLRPFPIPNLPFDTFPQSPPVAMRVRRDKDGGKSPSFSHLTLSHIGKNTVTYSPFGYSPRSNRTRERFHSQENLTGDAASQTSEALITRRQSGRPSLPRVPRSSSESVDMVETSESDKAAQASAPSTLLDDKDSRFRDAATTAAQDSRTPATLALNRTESIASSASPFRSVRLEDKEDVLEWFGIRSNRTFDCGGSPSKAKATLAPLWEADKEDEKDE
mmetsp:Transcript_11735/g.20151  ORF Transcript_11735/g.20151 Transcript_11735/m.20151 type:complete len:381 (+) Transcript_11735:122-1264(+)|eukprot:CAMPEP_0184694676 /NCGR_PEP_ID=MMETSP0313-20130426/2552_1 /TAXON_ID=2792 /ORGANISM="Porphyridium aerugineum, Strain SAG 1380-2" /LENGTH=380 /DNA_ID=CAMNT_0027153003 /DNA_START=92 /DNA_END=1234 /DNA_ORIENTATION=+